MKIIVAPSGKKYKDSEEFLNIENMKSRQSLILLKQIEKILESAKEYYKKYNNLDGWNPPIE